MHAQQCSVCVSLQLSLLTARKAVVMHKMYACQARCKVTLVLHALSKCSVCTTSSGSSSSYSIPGWLVSVVQPETQDQTPLLSVFAPVVIVHSSTATKRAHLVSNTASVHLQCKQ
jgi:hypothetical protein